MNIAQKTLDGAFTKETKLRLQTIQKTLEGTTTKERVKLWEDETFISPGRWGKIEFKPDSKGILKNTIMRYVESVNS